MKYILITMLLLLHNSVFAQETDRIDSLIVLFEATKDVKYARDVLKECSDVFDNTVNLDTIYSDPKDEYEDIRMNFLQVYIQHLYRNNKYAKSIRYCYECVDYYKKNKNYRALVNIFNILSLSYKRIGNMEQAIKCAVACDEYQDKSIASESKDSSKKNVLKNRLIKAASLNNIAALYCDHRKYEDARRYIQESLKYSSIITPDNVLDPDYRIYAYYKVSFLNKAAVIYSCLKLYDESYDYACQAFLIDSLIADVNQPVVEKKMVMADVLSNMGREREAMKIYNEIVRLAESDSSKVSVFALEKSLRKVGRNEDALKLARKQNSLFAIKENLLCLANKSNDPVEIKKYMNEVLQINDSISKNEDMKLLEQFNVKFDMEKKDQKIVQQNYELENHKTKLTLYICCLALLLLLITLAVVALVRNNIIRKKLAKAVAQLQETNKELVQINSVKDRLIRVISHDLSGTTANVNMLAHMIMEKMKNELTDMMAVQCDTLKSFLDNLLIWARMQRTGKIQLNKVNICLNEIVDEIIRLNSSAASLKNISLQSDSEGKVNIQADRNIIHCIIRNLLSNALKFTPRGGRITIKFDNASVSVIDTGCGIEPENVKILVDGSKMLHTEGTNGEPGTGLGLSIVRDMIQMSGGKFEIESEVGNGSTFRMVF